MVDKKPTIDGEPWKDNLWNDCLLELLVKSRDKKGQCRVKFTDVEKLVIEKSHIITKYEIGRGGNNGRKR